MRTEHHIVGCRSIVQGMHAAGCSCASIARGRVVLRDLAKQSQAEVELSALPAAILKALQP
jgi:hypothetical protein